MKFCTVGMALIKWRDIYRPQTKMAGQAHIRNLSQIFEPEKGVRGFFSKRRGTGIFMISDRMLSI